MLFGAMAGYGVAYQTGNPWLGLAGGAVAGAVLCLPLAVSLVRVRVGMEQQFVLGEQRERVTALFRHSLAHMPRRTVPAATATLCLDDKQNRGCTDCLRKSHDIGHPTG